MPRKSPPRDSRSARIRAERLEHQLFLAEMILADMKAEATKVEHGNVSAGIRFRKLLRELVSHLADVRQASLDRTEAAADLRNRGT